MDKILKVFYRASAFACIFLIFYACNRHAASYELYVNAALDNGVSSIEGKRVLVYTKNESKNLILETETAEKIKKALLVYGFISADKLENSDYVLLYEYSIDSGKAVSSTESGYVLNPVTKRFEKSRSTNIDIEYTKQLTLKLFRAVNISDTSHPVWTGKAYIRDGSSNLGKTIGYLIAAAFEHFGKATGEDTKLIISSEDERLKSLN